MSMIIPTKIRKGKRKGFFTAASDWNVYSGGEGVDVKLKTREKVRPLAS